MPLPCFALYRDDEAEEAKRVVVFQAEEADGRRYFGGWLIDDKAQVVGFEDDFELLTEDQIRSEKAVALIRSLAPTLNSTSSVRGSED